MRDGCHLQTSPARAHTDRHARAISLLAAAAFQQQRLSATRGEGRANTQHKAQGTSERGGGARTCRPARRTPCTCLLPRAHAVSESLRAAYLAQYIQTTATRRHGFAASIPRRMRPALGRHAMAHAPPGVVAHSRFPSSTLTGSPLGHFHQFVTAAIRSVQIAKRGRCDRCEAWAGRGRLRR
jgi:hypothetical protein